jgi:transposase-like protein
LLTPLPTAPFPCNEPDFRTSFPVQAPLAPSFGSPRAVFTPPRCPYRPCPQHHFPTRDFYRRHGSYRVDCRPRPVPRFRCRSCGRTFSRQTFRADYYDHRPDLNSPLFELLASGVGLRQSGRLLRLSYPCVEAKFRKLARHLRRVNLNLQSALPEACVLQLDELETYEGERNTRPLSVPVLIERDTRTILWSESATIRPRGKMSDARNRRIQRSEARFGRRRDNSRRSLRRSLERGAALLRGHRWVVLETDEKSTYNRLAREAFGGGRLIHRTTNSRLPRTTHNPLFPINHTDAMARDGMGRLRRKSWLASKKRRYLDLGLQVYAAWKNLVRPRFNGEKQSPAALLGWIPRSLRLGEAEHPSAVAGTRARAGVAGGLIETRRV